MKAYDFDEDTWELLSTALGKHERYVKHLLTQTPSFCSDAYGTDIFMTLTSACIPLVYYG